MIKSETIDRVALGIFLAASLMIVFAARGDLWLDEIWSFGLARLIHSPLEILTILKIDNNHPLNTLWFYCMGEQRCLYFYRLHSVMAGIGAVFICGYVARRDWGRRTSYLSMIFMGSSFLLLNYLSEARGYSLAMFWGVLCYTILGSRPEVGRLHRIVVFWAGSILGILSHSSFVMLSLSFLLWSVAYELQNRRKASLEIRQIVVWHAVPSLFFVWWYFFFIKRMQIGGGDVLGVFPVLCKYASLVLGLPSMPVVSVIALFLLVVLIGCGICCLFRKHDPRWVFFLATLIVVPGVMLSVVQPEILYVRYFAVCFPFCILILAYLVAQFARRTAFYWRWLAIFIFILLVGGQVPRDSALFRYGRGQYSKALKYILDHSAQEKIIVGSDHDFRNKLVIDFYAHRIKDGRRLLYVKQGSWKKNTPDWIFCHHFDFSLSPQYLATRDGVQFELVEEYAYAGLSGWRWSLYERKQIN